MLSEERLDYFKKRLESEIIKIEGELGKVGKKNPEVEGDWEVETPDLNVGSSDENDLSDVYEEMQNRTALEDSLEESLVVTRRALEKIKKGAYGKCEVCAEDIGEKRLEAYPAAVKCVKHSNG